MQAFADVVVGPERNLGSTWSRLKNRVSLRSSSRIRPFKLLHEQFCIGLPVGMKCQAIWWSSD
jgi:hypothetical protein